MEAVENDEALLDLGGDLLCAQSFANDCDFEEPDVLTEHQVREDSGDRDNRSTARNASDTTSRPMKLQRLEYEDSTRVDSGSGGGSGSGSGAVLHSDRRSTVTAGGVGGDAPGATTVGVSGGIGTEATLSDDDDGLGRFDYGSHVPESERAFVHAEIARLTRELALAAGELLTDPVQTSDDHWTYHAAVNGGSERSGDLHAAGEPQGGQAAGSGSRPRAATIGSVDVDLAALQVRVAAFPTQDTDTPKLCALEANRTALVGLCGGSTAPETALGDCRVGQDTGYESSVSLPRSLPPSTPSALPLLPMSESNRSLTGSPIMVNYVNTGAGTAVLGPSTIDADAFKLEVLMMCCLDNTCMRTSKDWVVATFTRDSQS